MTTFKEQEQKRFDDEFVRLIDVDGVVKPVIKSFLSASHLRLLELVEKGLPEEKHLYRNATNQKDKEIFDRDYGFNSCLSLVKAVILKAKEEVR